MECQCLCRPLGHDPSICSVNAMPGLTVPLAPRTGARVPACAFCFRAVTAPRKAEGQLISTPPSTGRLTPVM